jgi:hypothetical protein
MQPIDSHGPLSSTPSARVLDHLSASLGGMTRRLDQFACGLVGHDELLRFEPRRLSLRCTLCGHQSEGWEMTLPRPRRLLPA